MKVKLGELELILNILNPMFESKCNGKLSLQLLDVIEEIQSNLDKVQKVREKVVKEYALKDENDNYVEKDLNGGKVYDFGENTEKVNEELKEIYETEVDLVKQVDTERIDEDVKINPFNLKFLKDKGLLKVS